MSAFCSVQGRRKGFPDEREILKKKMSFQEKGVQVVCLMSICSFPRLLAVLFRLMPSKRHRHFGTALLTIPQALSRRDCFIRKVYGFLFSLKGKCDFVVFNSIGISPF